MSGGQPTVTAACLGDRIVITALTGTIRTFGNVCFEIRIIALWVVAHDAAFDAAEVALHAAHSGAS